MAPAPPVGGSQRAVRIGALLQTIEGIAADPDASVSYGRIVQVRRIALNEPSLAERARTAERTLLQRFQETEGRILNHYDCSHTMGGCALVRAHDSGVRLESILNTADPRLAALEAACLEVRDDLLELPGDGPAPRAVRDAMQALYAVLTDVLAMADRVARTARDRERAAQDAALIATGIGVAQDKLTAARRRVDAVQQRWARGVYLSGALLGTLLTLAVVAAVGAACAAFWSAFLPTAPLVMATVFGAFGAVVSVVQRMSTGRLVLDNSASEGQLRAFALLRPAVGAVSAAVAQFALGSGILAADGVHVNAAVLGPYAVIGFAAGFSERFAVDMIERAGRVLAGDSTPVPPGASAAPTTGTVTGTAGGAYGADGAHGADGKAPER